MTPGGDGELLRALAEAFAKAWGEHPDNTVVDAEMAIAALRTVLREHPEAAMKELGYEPYPAKGFRYPTMEPIQAKVDGRLLWIAPREVQE